MKVLAAACGIALALAATVQAQELLRDANSISSRDTKYQDQTPIHWYTVSAQGGTRVTVRVASVDFTPEIVVTPPGADDLTFDGRDGSAAGSYSLSTSQSLRVGVTTESAAAVGSYTIRVAQVAQEQPIGVGAQRGGMLAYDDERSDQGTLVDWWPVSVHRGDRVAVVATSSDFSPSLIGSFGNDVDVTMDQAASGSAVVRFTASTDQTLRLGVTSDEADSEGAYQISVLLSNAAKSISIGDTVNGTLDESDDMISGQPMDAYTLSGKSGDTVEIELDASDFDPILYVQDASGAVQQSDDISEDDLNAKMEYTFGTDGTVELRVYAVDSDGRGSYSLSVRPGTPPAGASLSTPIYGTLDDNDETVNGTPTDRYVFRGDDGQHVVIDLESDDFDTYLTIIGIDGRTFENDDIDDNNTNSRLDYVFPRSGVLQILASGYSDDDQGSYTLTVAPSDGGGI